MAVPIDSDLESRLCRLRNGDLQALMLAVMRARAGRQTPRDVRRAHGRRFTQPCDVDARVLHRVDSVLYEAAADFSLLELSPVAPLGVCSAVGTCDPIKSMATVRNLEVLSDSSNVLAVEAADRRSAGQRRVDLGASHRLLRTQSLEHPDHRAHFRIFVLCSMFPRAGSGRVEEQTILAHLGVYRRAIESLGGGIDRVSVSCSGQPWTAIRDRLADSCFEIDDQDDRIGRNAYYEGLSFVVRARTPAGPILPLGDGGFTAWGAKLLSHGKERTLISAFGTEILCRYLAPGPDRGSTEASSEL